MEITKALALRSVGSLTDFESYLKGTCGDRIRYADSLANLTDYIEQLEIEVARLQTEISKKIGK